MAMVYVYTSGSVYGDTDQHCQRILQRPALAQADMTGVRHDIGLNAALAHLYQQILGLHDFSRFGASR
jgi:hypothetical protein